MSVILIFAHQWNWWYRVLRYVVSIWTFMRYVLSSRFRRNLKVTKLAAKMRMFRALGKVRKKLACFGITSKAVLTKCAPSGTARIRTSHRDDKSVEAL